MFEISESERVVLGFFDVLVVFAKALLSCVRVARSIKDGVALSVLPSLLESSSQASKVVVGSVISALNDLLLGQALCLDLVLNGSSRF